MDIKFIHCAQRLCWRSYACIPKRDHCRVERIISSHAQRCTTITRHLLHNSRKFVNHIRNGHRQKFIAKRLLYWCHTVTFYDLYSVQAGRLFILPLDLSLSRSDCRILYRAFLTQSITLHSLRLLAPCRHSFRLSLPSQSEKVLIAHYLGKIVVVVIGICYPIL